MRDGKSLLQFSKFRIIGILREGKINQCVDSHCDTTDVFGTSSSAAEEMSFTRALERRIRRQMQSKCLHGCCIRDDLKLRAWSTPGLFHLRRVSSSLCRMSRRDVSAGTRRDREREGRSLPTFHFGEGEHRTVAGGQRGNPCGVFLHDDELGWAELPTASTTSLKPTWCTS